MHFDLIVAELERDALLDRRPPVADPSVKRVSRDWTGVEHLGRRDAVRLDQLASVQDNAVKRVPEGELRRNHQLSERHSGEPRVRLETGGHNFA